MNDTNAIAKIQFQGDVVIVTLTHDELVSSQEIQQLEEIVGPLIQLEHKIKFVIDFSRIKMISSSALGFLLRTHKDLTGRGGRLGLCCLNHKFADSHNDTYVYELLKVVELDTFFEISNTVDGALERINRPIPLPEERPLGPAIP